MIPKELDNLSQDALDKERRDALKDASEFLIEKSAHYSFEEIATMIRTTPRKPKQRFTISQVPMSAMWQIHLDGKWHSNFVSESEARQYAAWKNGKGSNEIEATDEEFDMWSTLRKQVVSLTSERDAALAGQAAIVREAADLSKRQDDLLCSEFNRVKDEPPLHKQILALASQPANEALERVLAERGKEHQADDPRSSG